jgi:hypothetical protein
MFPPVHVAATLLSLVAADQVPDFNVESSCRDAEKRAAPVANAGSCLRAERDARDQLTREWGDFAGSDKSYCGGLAKLGGEASYVELLTCLEMARDAKRQKGQDSGVASRNR